MELGVCRAQVLWILEPHLESGNNLFSALSNAIKRGGSMASSKKSSAIKIKQTKSQVLAALAEETGLSKKDVQAVFTATKALAARHLAALGSGELTIPELGVKLRRVKKAARKAGMARNPFTGEMAQVEARPASLSVRATAMKAIKDVVA